MVDLQSKLAIFGLYQGTNVETKLRSIAEVFENYILTNYDFIFHKLFDLENCHVFALPLWGQLLGFSNIIHKIPDDMRNTYTIDFNGVNKFARYDADPVPGKDYDILTPDAYRLMLLLLKQSKGIIPLVSNLEKLCRDLLKTKVFIRDTMKMQYLIYYYSTEFPSWLQQVFQKYDILPRPMGLGKGVFVSAIDDILGFLTDDVVYNKVELGNLSKSIFSVYTESTYTSLPEPELDSVTVKLLADQKQECAVDSAARLDNEKAANQKGLDYMKTETEIREHMLIQLFYAEKEYREAKKKAWSTNPNNVKTYVDIAAIQSRVEALKLNIYGNVYLPLDEALKVHVNTLERHYAQYPHEKIIKACSHKSKGANYEIKKLINTSHDLHAHGVRWEHLVYQVKFEYDPTLGNFTCNTYQARREGSHFSNAEYLKLKAKYDAEVQPDADGNPTQECKKMCFFPEMVWDFPLENDPNYRVQWEHPLSEFKRVRQTYMNNPEPLQ